MATREFITIIGYDENIATGFDNSNGHEDTAPGEFLEREFGWLEQSGLSLEDWALADGDVLWERYLLYLVQWAIEHNSDEYQGMSPACFDEWRELES